MKAKFGMVVVAGSGKIGGHVASRNRGGAYFRTKVTPVNPQTTAQSAVRSSFTTFAQGWKALTDAQRSAWNAAVTNYARTDVFGDIKNPSGFNLYVRLNQNLVTAGLTEISDPVLPDSVADENILTAVPDASSQLFPVTFSFAVPANAAIKVFATPQLSQGVTFVKSEFRLVDVIPPAGTSPFAFGAAYIAKFGTLVTGTKIFLKFVVVNADTGQQAEKPIFVTTVVP